MLSARTSRDFVEQQRQNVAASPRADHEVRFSNNSPEEAFAEWRTHR